MALVVSGRLPVGASIVDQPEVGGGGLGGPPRVGDGVFDHQSAHALRHDGIGVRIGKLSANDGSALVLRCGCANSRTFLRSLGGYELSVWRLRRRDEVCEGMPGFYRPDNRGIRFVLQAVHDRRRWEDGRR